MPTPCCDPKCRACILIVLHQGTDDDYIQYSKELALAKSKAPFADRVPVPTIDEFPDLFDVLPDLAKEYRRLSAEIAPLEERKKELGKDINALLDAVGVKSIKGDGWMAIRFEESYTESLSREKLLMAGVSLEQLDAGIERKPKASYVQVKEVKGETD